MQEKQLCRGRHIEPLPFLKHLADKTILLEQKFYFRKVTSSILWRAKTKSLALALATFEEKSGVEIKLTLFITLILQKHLNALHTNQSILNCEFIKAFFFLKISKVSPDDLPKHFAESFWELMKVSRE